MRFDVALHQLRLYKSRSQAAAAIESGEALLDGKRVKASHAVKPGDRITLAAEGRTRTLDVLELPARPVSKEAARAMVREVGGE